jgi:hypothetical protein
MYVTTRPVSSWWIVRDGVLRLSGLVAGLVLADLYSCPLSCREDSTLLLPDYTTRFFFLGGGGGEGSQVSIY